MTTCEEKPYFVIIRKTETGFSFDNDVIYKSALASHTLSQATDALHPALQIKSDWGIRKESETITKFLTGQAGAKALEASDRNRNLILKKTKTNQKTGKTSTISKYGLIAPSKKGGGYTLTRVGKQNEGLSVAELSNLLSKLSEKTNNIKVRGSPLEYKRLLDYIQFLMVEKVNNDPTLYLVRPNNYHVMDNVHTEGVSLEDAYNKIWENNGIRNNSTMYGKAYFVTMDRVAALASVVRTIPTIYQTGKQDYYKVPITNVFPKIRKIITDMLMKLGYTTPKTISTQYKRTLELVTPAGRPVITAGPLFAWFLNTRNVTKNAKNIVVGSDFHTDKIPLNEKALILFYWIFNYPSPKGDVNEQVIKYFLAILDTFHDFTDTRATKVFKNIWPESTNPRPHRNSKSKSRSGIDTSHIPPTSQQHKFLVKLLGVDIYRKVNAYNNSIKNTLAMTNKRNDVPIGLRVAHFLYLIANILGSHESRGLISACEELSSRIMIQLADDRPINKAWNQRTPNIETGKNICNLLEKEGACIVIDAVNGSVPTCMKKYSVFHNVGLLDPTDKGVLSWGEVIGEGGCIESAKVQAAKKKQKQKRDAAIKMSKTMAERSEQAKKTRLQRKRNEAAAAKAEAVRAAAKKRQASNRRSRLAFRRAQPVNKPPVNRVRNNVNQPMGNASRNKLIEYIKKKNLPNAMITRLVKRYNNKQQIVNQIIREANNSGKTAQRMGAQPVNKPPINRVRNNVNQPMGNASRNKLIENLKKKNLANATIINNRL